MSLQPSKYAHTFRHANGQVVVFNSLTMESWELSQAEAELLAEPSQADPESENCRAFVEAGLLVTEDEVPGAAIARLNGLRSQRAERRGGRFATLRIALTERCNMSCSYCFQQALYPENQPRMSEEVFERELTWFINQARGEDVNVQYFGGEPLLEWRLIELGDQMLQAAKAAGKVSGYRQTITTNGTVLTEDRAEWLARHDFELLVSFDGPPEVNDQLRVLKNGRGTYDKAADGLRRWVGAGGRGAILMTATELNLPRLPEYVQWFIESSGLPIEVVALNSPQPTPSGWETGGPELAEAVFKIWTYCLSKRVAFHGPGTFIPEHISASVPQTDHCVDGDLFGDGAGSWPIYVSAAGDRSLCLVHHNDHRVQTSPARTHEDAHNWHLAAASPQNCDTCIASQLCGGPCSLEQLMWGPTLNSDRCGFVRTMTQLVLTQA